MHSTGNYFFLADVTMLSFLIMKLILLGSRGNEQEKNSPGNAFYRITKLTGQMLDANIKSSDRQNVRIKNQINSTPPSSARSTPTVHWEPTSVTGKPLWVQFWSTSFTF